MAEAADPQALTRVLCSALAGLALCGSASAATVRLIFGGDVMLGRGVAQLPPRGLFEGVRFQLSSPDLAVANLESPLTRRRHLVGPNALEASPTSARLLNFAGFAAMGIANNHSGDAGPLTSRDTARALAAAGLVPLGKDYVPRVFERHGVRIAFLSFDATRQGRGVAEWDPRRVRTAVRRAHAEADVVVVGLHAGAEYFTTTDPYTLRLARFLSHLGVDVVWGTGPHVVQPVQTIGRTVVATSLGNLLFDQHIPGTQQGALLEVVAGRDGVRAYRIGATDDTAGPVSFRGWRPPHGDAVALGDDWWTLARPVRVARQRHPRLRRFGGGDVVATALGDANGDGSPDLVVSFRRPYRKTDVNALIPRRLLVDRRGRTAHLGLYRPADVKAEWIAGTLLRPVAEVAACDGSLAVGYSTLNQPAVVATGAWRWGGFGFQTLPDLAGRGVPGCADVDGDRRLDPVILARTR